MLALRHRLSVLAERLTLLTGRFGIKAAQWGDWNRLVFVCTGNICRSPYAEVLARSHGFSAVSAGVDTSSDCPANASAIAEATRRGIDLNAHKTTMWKDLDLQPGDLVIAVQLRHARAVASKASQAGVPVVLMSSLLSPVQIVRDPYGRDPQAFMTAFDQIERAMASIKRLTAEARSELDRAAGSTPRERNKSSLVRH
jgi:protein-tyrosine phosphatase